MKINKKIKFKKGLNLWMIINSLKIKITIKQMIINHKNNKWKIKINKIIKLIII